MQWKRIVLGSIASLSCGIICQHSWQGEYWAVSSSAFIALRVCLNTPKWQVDSCTNSHSMQITERAHMQSLSVTKLYSGQKKCLHLISHTWLQYNLSAHISTVLHSFSGIFYHLIDVAPKPVTLWIDSQVTDKVAYANHHSMQTKHVPIVTAHKWLKSLLMCHTYANSHSLQRSGHQTHLMCRCSL